MERQGSFQTYQEALVNFLKMKNQTYIERMRKTSGKERQGERKEEERRIGKERKGEERKGGQRRGEEERGKRSFRFPKVGTRFRN